MSTNNLVWIDCEMTGLNPDADVLLEIAVIVTDTDLNPLDEGLDIVIHAEESELALMPDVVRKMHQRSALTEAVRASDVSVSDAQQRVLAYLAQHIDQPRTAPLAGNSIATDRAFLRRYMPELDEFLHYRMIDVSSLKELARRWYPRVYFHQPEKDTAHRALADIHESIQELRYYRQALFVSEPGPSSDEAREIAAEITRA